ncbi:hypothetical protein ASG57_26925 [Bradyrhizobium sp. Leaf396]|nr:hypothetical protein ASG57_26925 [Bradyrhizobium sp. Leaf396]
MLNVIASKKTRYCSSLSYTFAAAILRYENDASRVQGCFDRIDCSHLLIALIALKVGNRLFRHFRGCL